MKNSLCSRLLLCGMLLVGGVTTLHAQAPLYLVNPGTTVDRVRFRGNRAFPDGRLQREIVTRGRSLFDRLKDRLPFMRGRTYPFNPVELQKDRRRLENFYRRHGFLHAAVRYEAQLDTTENSIDITFLIQEGPPLLLREVAFFAAGGDSVTAVLEPGLRKAWNTFVERLRMRYLDLRYSDAISVEIANQTLYWLKDQGYAFAEVYPEVSVVTREGAEGARVELLLDPGPVTRVETIDLPGVQRLSTTHLLRALPLRVGERFAQGKFREGQTRLMELGTFTYVLGEIPPQPRDSTVRVQYRVREGIPRRVQLQGGYASLEGVRMEGEWSYRMFLRRAHRLSLGGIWETGLGAIRSPDVLVPRRERVSLTYYHPLLFSHLAASYEVFFDRRYSSTVQEQRWGMEGQLTYTFYRFRTLTGRYNFEWVRPIGEAAARIGGGYYTRNVYALTGTFGRLDDYFYPTEGTLIRPLLEGSGLLIPSGVQYIRSALEVVHYRPISRRLGVAMRGFGGRLWLLGASRSETDPEVEERLRAIRFYAGGAQDVRGWGASLLGPKVVVDSTGAYYRPLGGNIKLLTNAEFRWQPLELHPEWQAVAFVDAGQLAQALADVRLSGFKVGTGIGIRYRTPFGILRFDVAYKVNPDPEDLRPPGAEAARWWRRWALYIGIGQAF